MNVPMTYVDVVVMFNHTNKYLYGIDTKTDKTITYIYLLRKVKMCRNGAGNGQTSCSVVWKEHDKEQK